MVFDFIQPMKDNIQVKDQERNAKIALAQILTVLLCCQQ